jgi:uncharacterized protein YjbJ (UPF0337 family)
MAPMCREILTAMRLLEEGIRAQFEAFSCQEKIPTKGALSMENVITGKWTEIKAEVLKAWTEISHADLEGMDGKLESVIGLLQQKLGYAREEAATKLMQLAAIVEGDQTAIAEAKSEEKEPTQH